MSKTKVIDGIRYHADRPDSCRACYFYKNRKIGCILGKENCYYLAEVVKTEQEKKCEGCCYAKGQPCVSACCYKDLDKWLQERRKKAGGSHEYSYAKTLENFNETIQELQIGIHPCAYLHNYKPSKESFAQST